MVGEMRKREVGELEKEMGVEMGNVFKERERLEREHK